MGSRYIRDLSKYLQVIAFADSMGRPRISQFFLWAALLLCCWQHASSDTIVIEKVVCQHTATGIDAFAQAAVAGLGAIVGGAATAVAGGAVVIGTGGVAVGTVPLTASAVASAAAGGASAGNSAIKWIDSVTSGTDDLIINISGEQVWPEGGGHGSISAGDTIYPDVSFDFDGSCRIQFIEYDSGSDNDDLGWIDVNADVSPGEDYRINEALLFSDSEGDLYKVTYRVERNDRGKDEPKWMVCGTAACRECEDDPCCKQASNQGLDRDGDKPDLKTCPPGFSDRGWKKYDLWWPADDVYLRICGNQLTSGGSEECNHTIDVDGWIRRMTGDLRSAQALKKQLIRRQMTSDLRSAEDLKKQLILRRQLNQL